MHVFYGWNRCAGYQMDGSHKQVLKQTTWTVRVSLNTNEFENIKISPSRSQQLRFPYKSWPGLFLLISTWKSRSTEIKDNLNRLIFSRTTTKIIKGQILILLFKSILQIFNHEICVSSYCGNDVRWLKFHEKVISSRILMISWFFYLIIVYIF
jgi:hypothetical protein